MSTSALMYPAFSPIDEEARDGGGTLIDHDPDRLVLPPIPCCMNHVEGSTRPCHEIDFAKVDHCRACSLGLVLCSP
jgi:hypothetical protein